MKNTPRTTDTVNEFRQDAKESLRSAKDALLPPGVPTTTQIFRAAPRRGHVWHKN